MIEFDITDYSSKWYYQDFDVHLEVVRDVLKTLHKRNPENGQLDYCFEDLFEYYQEAIREKRINPTSIKVFESEHLAEEWLENLTEDDYELDFILGDSHRTKEIIQVERFEKQDSSFHFFNSKEDAEEWIKLDSLTNFVDENDVTETFTYEKQSAIGDFHSVERFLIGKRDSCVIFDKKEDFESYFNRYSKEPSLPRNHIKITYTPPKEGIEYFFYEVYSYESLVVDVNMFNDQYARQFFIIHYIAQEFTSTNDYLNYHLKTTFESDALSFRTFLKDALLEYDNAIMIPEKYLNKLNDYIDNNLGNGKPFVSESEILVVKNEDFILDKSKLYNIEDGDEDLEETQITSFFTFFNNEISKNGKPFLSKTDVMILQQIGLRLPTDGIPQKQFKLNITPTEKGKIYKLFHVLWVANGEKNGKQEKYAEFIKTYFLNFSPKPAHLDSITRGMEKGNPAFVEKIRVKYLKLPPSI